MSAAQCAKLSQVGGGEVGLAGLGYCELVLAHVSLGSCSSLLSLPILARLSSSF